MKKYLLFLGIGTVVLTYVFNLSYAVDNYGIVTNPLSLSVFADGSSGGGGSSGGEPEEGENFARKTITQNTIVILTCDTFEHTVKKYPGRLTTCEGKGDVPCEEQWVSDGPPSEDPNSTVECPGIELCTIQ